MKINNGEGGEESWSEKEERERESEQSIDGERPASGVRDKDFWVERRGVKKKLSALTDSGVERGALAKVKRASAARGGEGQGRKRRGGKRATRCSVFPLANAPSRLVKLHPAYFPSPPPVTHPSLPPSLFRFLARFVLRYNHWSTPDPKSYLYDICVHYLARKEYKAPGFLREANRAASRREKGRGERECLLYLRARN